MSLPTREDFLVTGLDPMICYICLEVQTQPTTPPCNHTFCRECIELWLRRSNTCPLDRSVLFQKSGEDADAATSFESPAARGTPPADSGLVFIAAEAVPPIAISSASESRPNFESVTAAEPEGPVSYQRNTAGFVPTTASNSAGVSHPNSNSMTTAQPRTPAPPERNVAGRQTRRVLDIESVTNRQRRADTSRAGDRNLRQLIPRRQWLLDAEWYAMASEIWQQIAREQEDQGAGPDPLIYVERQRGMYCWPSHPDLVRYSWQEWWQEARRLRAAINFRGN